MDPLMSSGKPKAKPNIQNLFRARDKESLKWIESPLKDLKGKEFKSFHVRHEASMLELFFDLFFVANLATFTAYHEITTSGTVAAYIGFFLILWSTWFQITIFDVRFSADSVFERFCKLYQFICFAIFAAVGSNFNPGTYASAKYYRIYQTMAVILGITRICLAIQYAVIATFVCRRYKQLVVPFILIVLTFLISGGGLTISFLGFNEKSISKFHILWWILLPVEGIVIVSISSFWRMLSFKDTHMNERLSLLTMIIIGEGVIGVTKTAGYLWPSQIIPEWGNLISLLSIVVMLLLMWQIYFDNHPHADYGTIKQQWWAFSHFFLHLGIVGTVEGSNRITVFYSATQSCLDIRKTIRGICSIVPTPSKQTFVASMNYALQYNKLEYYDPLGDFQAKESLNHTLENNPSQPHFCDLIDGRSTANQLINLLQVGTFKKYKIVSPPPFPSYYRTYRTTYTYLWVSFAVTMFMLLIFLWIVRRKQHDGLEWIRMVFRLVIAIVAVGIACINFIEITFLEFVSSPWVVTTVCALMSAILFVDRVCRFLGVWNFKKKYAIPPPAPSHAHSHGDDHGSVEKHGSMAFGGNHHPSITSTIFSPQGYEMTPVFGPRIA